MPSIVTTPATRAASTVAALVATAVLAAPVHAQQREPLAPAEYTVKEDTPRVGSNIRRRVATGSTVPLNRRYEEFTADERASVHGWWENIPAGDEPPFPEDGLKPLHEAVAKVVRKLQVPGRLLLVANVAPDGQVSEVKALESTDAETTKYAATILMLTKFKPAKCAGQPCRMDFPVLYTFKVD